MVLEKKLIKDGVDGDERGIFDVPSDVDEGSSVFSLKPHSFGVDGVTSAFWGWSNINTNGDDVGKFLWQIKRTKIDGKKLNIRATDTLCKGDVSRVTPPVVNKKGELSFLLTACCGVSVHSDGMEDGDCRDAGLTSPLLHPDFNACYTASASPPNPGDRRLLSSSESQMAYGDQLIQHVDDLGGILALGLCCEWPHGCR